MYDDRKKQIIGNRNTPKERIATHKINAAIQLSTPKQE